MKINNIKIILPILFFAIVLPLWGNVDYNIPFVKQNGLLLIQAEVNNTNGWFVFDSGAEFLMIHSNDEDENGTKADIASLDGYSASSLISIDHIKIGELSKKNIEGYKTDLSLVRQFLGKEIKGIIHAGFFNPQSIAIDLEHNTIRLYEEVEESIINSYRHKISFDTALGVPVINMVYNDKNYRFIVDSGATTNLLSKAFLREADDADVINDGSAYITTVGQQTECLKIKMKAWSVADKYYLFESFVVKDFDYLNIDLSKKEKIAGLISLETLSKVGVFIDLKEMKIYF